MADVKISELSLAAAAGDSVVPASDAGGTATNKVTLQSIANLATPAGIGAVASDTSVDSANATTVPNMVTMNVAQYANTTVDNTTLYIVTE